MLNRVMIIGRLGQDPQLKYSQTGSPIATFSVATDETYTDRDGIRQQRTEWFRVVVFQKAAENCSRYLHKGSLVYVEGSLQTRKWQDQQGVERSLVEIKAQRVDFLERRAAGDEYGRKPYGGQEDFPPEPGGESFRRPAPPRYAQDQSEPSSRSHAVPVFPQDALDENPDSNEPAQGPSEGSEQSAMDQVPF